MNSRAKNCWFGDQTPCQNRAEQLEKPSTMETTLPRKAILAPQDFGSSYLNKIFHQIRSLLVHHGPILRECRAEPGDARDRQPLLPKWDCSGIVGKSYLAANSQAILTLIQFLL